MTGLLGLLDPWLGGATFILQRPLGLSLFSLLSEREGGGQLQMGSHAEFGQARAFSTLLGSQKPRQPQSPRGGAVQFCVPQLGWKSQQSSCLCPTQAGVTPNYFCGC